VTRSVKENAKFSDKNAQRGEQQQQKRLNMCKYIFAHVHHLF